MRSIAIWWWEHKENSAPWQGYLRKVLENEYLEEFSGVHLQVRSMYDPQTYYGKKPASEGEVVPQICKDSTVFKQQELLDHLSQISTWECSKPNKRRYERVKGQV